MSQILVHLYFTSLALYNKLARWTVWLPFGGQTPKWYTFLPIKWDSFFIDLGLCFTEEEVHHVNLIQKLLSMKFISELVYR